MPYSPKSVLLAPTPPDAAARAVRFIMARPHGEYTEVDIAGTIVPSYVAVCAGVGLDAVLLIAQMIHETGNLASWWAARPRRNPAGIGVTGRTQGAQPPTGIWQQRNGWWVEGIAFASWKDDAIPAHIGRLLAYAVTDAAANDAQRQLIEYAMLIRPLPASYRGVAPTITGLNGRWAVPGKDYGQRIATVANRMLAG